MTQLPDATSTVAKIMAAVDTLSPDRRDIAILGVELWAYANTDANLPDHVKSAAFAARYELARQQQPQPEAEAKQPDDPPWDIPIGTIAGCAVTGSYSDDAPHELFSAGMEWNSLTFHTDGTDYINFTLGEAGDGYKELGCVGDMHLWEWGKIKELAQTDIMEQLIALARAKATYAPPRP